MRAALSVVWVGAVMFSRTYRALVVVMGWLVTLAVLPVTVATVVHVVPLPDTCRVKSRVFQVVDSPPAPAWRTVKDWMANDDPRSTCQNLVAPSEHHLSELPPETLPLTAFAGPSLALHEESAVAVLLRATFVGPPPPPPYTSNSSIRAAPLPSLAGVVTLSRTYRAETVEIGWYVRLVRLPETVTRVVKFVPSVLVAMVNAPVFQPVCSPPRPACLTTNELTFMFEP